jgi:hypothetical protein
MVAHAHASELLRMWKSRDRGLRLAKAKSLQDTISSQLQCKHK